MPFQRIPLRVGSRACLQAHVNALLPELVQHLEGMHPEGVGAGAHPGLAGTLSLLWRAEGCCMGAG